MRCAKLANLQHHIVMIMMMRGLWSRAKKTQGPRHPRCKILSCEKGRTHAATPGATSYPPVRKGSTPPATPGAMLEAPVDLGCARRINIALGVRGAYFLFARGCPIAMMTK